MQETVRKGRMQSLQEKAPDFFTQFKTEKPKEKLEKSREERDNEQKDFHCATVNMSSEVISMCVVPVMVRHKLSTHVVKTYAMLNTCSQAAFAKENLLSDLGIQRRKTSITVKAMNGKVTKSSEVMEVLKVAQASNGKAERVWVKLPCTYTQEDLPVDSNKVATIDKIKRWGYMDKIKAEVNANDNKEVTLLIAANCVKALGQRELIASKNGGPYAFRTILGWCIVGPMYSQNKSEKLSCAKIMVKSMVTGFPLNLYFTQLDKVKVTSIEG